MPSTNTTGRTTESREFSGRTAAMLVTADGTFKLRIQGRHPFSDPDVDALVIRC